MKTRSGLLLTIASRNLVRQRRRNLLLGTAIAFGAMILILANAFAHGISDVIFTRIVKLAAGHVSVNFTVGGDVYKQLFYDGERIKRIARETVSDVTQFSEAMGFMSRAIGNGRSDNIIMVGVDLTAEISDKELQEVMSNFRMIEGRFEDLADSTVENGTLLSEQKAKYLNVKKGDVVNVRFRNVRGQQQTARLTVIGIFKPANAFMSAPVFIEMRNVKRILGYRPYETGQIYIHIKDPKRRAKREADKLHDALRPGLARMEGTACRKGRCAGATTLGFKSDSASLQRLSSLVVLTAGDSAHALTKKGTLISAPLAESLGMGAGDTCTFTYRAKFSGKDTAMTIAVGGVFRRAAGSTPPVIFVNEAAFYDAFYDQWPVPCGSWAFAPDSIEMLYAALAPEWILAPRSKTTADIQKRYREIARTKAKAVVVDVQSMYEAASAVLNMEAALNVITLAAVMVLFFIILIGVVNTLRMTIRERTREIGTIRAIGMQRSDVRNVFVLETLLLALIAALAGAALAFLAMWGIGSIPIDPQDNPMGMLLVNKHVHFAPTLLGTVFYIAFIAAMAAVTAYFPARRAANMAAADALRHFE